MKWLGFAAAVSRRTLIVGSLVVMSVGVIHAQQAPAATQTPAAEPPDQFKFSSEAATIVWLIKPDKAADFEAVWTAVKARLAAGPKPEYKALFDSIKMLKAVVDTSPGAPPPAAITYVWYIDAPSRTLSYSPTAFLYDSTGGTAAERTESDAAFTKLQGTVTSILTWPLNVLK